jgi:copper homeostasis protein
MDGVVLGLLHRDARVDVARTKALVELARPLPVTFHRAFDVSENPEAALEDVIQTGASRILTSGGEARATDAVLTLARLVQAARNRIVIMPCGGINSENIVDVVRKTLAQEVHTSAGTSNRDVTGNGNNTSTSRDTMSSIPPVAWFEERVAKLVSLLGGVAHNELAK